MKAKFFALAALVLGLASCQNDFDDANVGVGGEVDFQLAVSAPEFGATRADADGSNGHDSAFGAIDYLSDAEWANVDLRYTLEVYDYDPATKTIGDAPVKDRMVKVLDEYAPVVFDLRLVPNRHYHFVVFADFVEQGSLETPTVEAQANIGKHHVIGNTLANITLKNDAINTELTDAYFATAQFEIKNSAAKDMVLRRPYGKVRVVATDLHELNLNVEATSVKVTYTAPNANKFNAVYGTISGEGATTFEATYNVTTDTYSEYTVGYDKQTTTALNGTVRKSHMTLSTDYILATDTQTPIHFTVAVYDGEQIIKETAFSTDIPVQRNYLTTVIGNVLTTATEINVSIDDNFYNADNIEDEPFFQTVWDGESIEEPSQAVDETGAPIADTYVVDQPSELAWLAAAVNGTLPATRAAVAADSFSGKTFVLTTDLNLNGEAWTPIGTSSNPFKGVFDGGNHIISNLCVDGGTSSNQGLFGYTTDGEIKNIIVENAIVKGRLNIGVVAGTPYTSKYTNITVRGHVEVNGMAYVGGVGGKNAYADWTNITVNVDETSYVKANSIENGTAYRTYVGGVVGFNGEGGHSFTNITSNINVEGSTCDVGGLFGIAHYNNKFENCSCSGNVTIYAAEEVEEAQEIGGIAGVWHNENGTSVVFANCVFEGALTTNVEGVNFCYGGLVGKAYSETGTGKLLLNGVEFNKDGVSADFINAELAAGRGFVMPFDLTFKATASNAYGVTGLNQLNGGILDGAGHTLKVTGANGTWGSAINTTGGTIKNVTVAGGFRGIFVNHNGSHSEKVVLENVTINGPTYTISCDQGKYQGLEATGCTINGWTSYAATIGEVKFTNCSFGKGAGYAFCRPYAPTTFEGCNFCEGYAIDARAAVKFINCTVNGEALTAENLATLVTGNVANAKIVSTVSTSEALVAALAAGYDVVFANDITVAATSGGYNKAGILQNKCQTIDGNGFTLTVTGAGATWDCAIYTNGGVIKNLTVKGAMRGIFTAGTKADLYIENVKFQNVIYTFNSDGGNKEYGVYVSNSVVNGWTSHSDVHKEVVYTNCSFGEGSGYKFCRPYGPTSFVDCTFCAGYTVDQSQTKEITFTNCTFEE